MNKVKKCLRNTSLLTFTCLFAFGCNYPSNSDTFSSTHGQKPKKSIFLSFYPGMNESEFKKALIKENENGNLLDGMFCIPLTELGYKDSCEMCFTVNQSYNSVGLMFTSKEEYITVLDDDATFERYGFKMNPFTGEYFFLEHIEGKLKRLYRDYHIDVNRVSGEVIYPKHMYRNSSDYMEYMIYKTRYIPGYTGGSCNTAEQNFNELFDRLLNFLGKKYSDEITGPMPLFAAHNTIFKRDSTFLVVSHIDVPFDSTESKSTIICLAPAELSSSKDYTENRRKELEYERKFYLHKEDVFTHYKCPQKYIIIDYMSIEDWNSCIESDKIQEENKQLERDRWQQKINRLKIEQNKQDSLKRLRKLKASENI